jgi:hypothetical protein
MAIDVSAACDASSNAMGSQAMSVVLSVVFGLYILFDSSLAAWVITRKSREAEARTLEKTGF